MNTSPARGLRHEKSVSWEVQSTLYPLTAFGIWIWSRAMMDNASLIFYELQFLVQYGCHGHWVLQSAARNPFTRIEFNFLIIQLVAGAIMMWCNTDQLVSVAECSSDNTQLLNQRTNRVMSDMSWDLEKYDCNCLCGHFSLHSTDSQTRNCWYRTQRTENSKGRVTLRIIVVMMS